MTTVWDLSRLRYTVRKLTGKFDTNQLPDSGPGTFTNGFSPVSVASPPGVDDYINDYYLYDMPEDARILKLRDFYNFFTIPNCGTYTIPQWINQIYDPIYIDNYQFAWYQSPDVFYRIWPELNFIDRNLFTPNGSTSTFTFTLTQTPIQQGTVVIGLNPNIDGQAAGALETFTDVDYPIPLDIPKNQYFVNPGTLTGNQGGTGTIDYLTGAVSITYATDPPSGATSSCHYHPYVASRPRDILYWQNQLFIRPIPNDTYAVKVMAYMMPSIVLSAASNAQQQSSFRATTASAGAADAGYIQGFDGTSAQAPFTGTQNQLPQFNEWWQLIAYGASLKILAEEGDWTEYAALEKIYEKQKLLAQRKTIKQLGSQRIPTPYADNNGAGPQFPIFPLY